LGIETLIESKLGREMVHSKISKGIGGRRAWSRHFGQWRPLI
jgi:hypothetical protein